ncbi:transposase [Nonomuraea sp. NPDC004702]
MHHADQPARSRPRHHHRGDRQPNDPAPLEITGISHNSTAALISESGDITRFTSSAKLARYNGRAPILIYSSDRERHRLRGGNRRLHTAAIVTNAAIPQPRNFWPGTRPTQGKRSTTRTPTPPH